MFNMKKLSQVEAENLIVLLMKALSDEWNANLQYKIHASRMRGLFADPIAEHLDAHANDEQDHAERLTKHFYSHGLPIDVTVEVHPGNEALEMIKLDMDDEVAAIDLYTKIIGLCEGIPELTDTRMLIEDILVDEVGHQDEDAAFIKAKIESREQGLIGAEKVAVASTFLMASEVVDNLGLGPLSEKYMKFASTL
jgi:bacterioferritin